MEKEKKILLSIQCLEFYLKLVELSLRSGHKNILMTHIELPSLMSIEDASELCFILVNKKMKT